MKCACQHKVKDHKFNAELESYDECLKCDCEGFDPETGSVNELRLGRE